MNVITSTIDRILNFGKANSFKAVLFGSSCCAEQLLQEAFGENSITKYGVDISPKSPKQADLLICTGTINAKAAPELLKLYQQMPKPKYVIAMGSCATSGGDFCGLYSQIQGADKVIPVDICLEGCPPKAQDLINAIEKLKNDIKSTSIFKTKEGIKTSPKSDTGTPTNAEATQTEDLEVTEL